MAVLSKLRFIKQVDKLTAAFLALSPTLTGDATDEETPGLGDRAIAVDDALDYGAQVKARDLQQAVAAYSDTDANHYLNAALERFVRQCSQQQQIRPMFKEILTALANYGRNSGYTGVSSLDSFASYFNVGAGGNWQALLPPDFRTLHYLALHSYPSARNVYPPPILDTPGLGAWASPTFTPTVAPFDVTKYNGFLPSMILAVVTDDITASGAGSIKLKGNGYTADGDGTPAAFVGDFSSHTLTYTISGAGTIAAGTILVFTGNAADVYTSITGHQLNSASGGAYYVIGMPPTTEPADAPAGATGVVVPATISRTSPPT